MYKFIITNCVLQVFYEQLEVINLASWEVSLQNPNIHYHDQNSPISAIVLTEFSMSSQAISSTFLCDPFQYNSFNSMPLRVYFFTQHKSSDIF
jgi:hypothetical protein